MFLVFGIIACSVSADEGLSPYFVKELDMGPLSGVVTFCGVAMIVAVVIGLVSLAFNIRKLLLVYLVTVLGLSLTQLSIGGYMAGRECEELRTVWFSTTSYYNTLRQDFKIAQSCCGFETFDDDYALDQDNKRANSLAPPDATPGCFVNLDVPGQAPLTCRAACDAVRMEHMQPIADACIGLGVVELIAVVIVAAICMVEKDSVDWFEDNPFHY